MVTALTRETGRLLSTQAQRGWRWRGRAVKLADGTGISMPDTPENQARYPQPSTQAPGVGFPLARLIGIICLSTGAVLEAAMGPHAGKGHSELDLFRSLLGALSEGDVLLADALYCNYFMIATLQAAGVDVLFEQHGARITDFRRGQALGKRDHRCAGRTQDAASVDDAAAVPGISQRADRTGSEGRRPSTGDHDARSAQVKGELSDLYARRWHVELDLRNIKTTLGMDVLRCLTPQMVEKELWVYLLAYNVIRLLMAQAAREAGVHPRELSFKHTVQMWTEWASILCGQIRPPGCVLPADRAAQRRQQTAAHRASGSQETTEILPLAESASGRGAPTDTDSWSSAMRLTNSTVLINKILSALLHPLQEVRHERRHRAAVRGVLRTDHGGDGACGSTAACAVVLEGIDPAG